MKSLRISIILSILVFVFLGGGIVAAINSGEVTVQAIFSSETLQAGQTTTVKLFFTSTSTDELKISNVGLHFDWMKNGTFFGFNLNNTVTIPTGGGTYEFQPITLKVPSTVTNGMHAYYVGIDGRQGTSSTPFSWDSPTTTMEVVSSSVNPTPTSTNSEGGLEEQNNLLMYGAIGGIIVVVVLLALVLLVRKKRTSPKPTANQGAAQPATSGSPQKPNPEQDFNI